MGKTALIYSSIDGQTMKISEKLKKVLTEQGETTEIFSIQNFNKNLDEFEKIIIGSSIRYGVHHQKIIQFIEQNRERLEQLKTVFFSVNLVARKAEKSTAETNPYLIKFFKTTTWRPTLSKVFAGKLDYKKYSFFDRIMIQFIMWMTKGPTDKNVEIDYTDWKDVDRFGYIITKM